MFHHQNSNLIPMLQTKDRRTDNSTTCVFTNARDEPNIAEWIAHHLLLGFDKVIVFDHLSKIPIASQIKNTALNNNRQVQIIPVTGHGNIKIRLMTKASNMAKQMNASWMLYLDADEFLNFNNGITHVQQFLSKFSKADAIGVNWLMFGTSGHTEQPPGLITENFTQSDMRLNPHVKSFVRPSCVVKVTNPHFFVIVNPKRYYSANATLMPMGPFNEQPLPFVNAVAYIAHYYTQSENEHIRRKTRVMDDGTTNKVSMYKNIHACHNECANNQLGFKYSNNTKKFLEKHGITL